MSPSRSDKILFWASFFTLIAAGIGFSVRGAILGDWGKQFGFTQTELGLIAGGGLVGFGVAIIFFSFCADLFGYGKLMLVAFLLHASSAVVTFAATPVFDAGGIFGMSPKDSAYMCLTIGMWLFALGNGTCEAVINPLTASLFPANKTHWLNILHAGWPGGLILGALITLGFENLGDNIKWEMKLGVFLIPVLLYGVMMFNRTFPRSEASSAGVSLIEMMQQIGLLGMAVAVALFGVLLTNELPGLLKRVGIDAPSWIGWVAAGALLAAYWVASRFAFGSIILAFIYVLHAMVGYVELGTDTWITEITKTVLENKNTALIAFIWTNLLMFTLRFFAGPIVHRINPVGLLFASAVIGTIGLVMLGLPFTNTTWLWLLAVSVYGVGKTFYWPTMLGVISERFPKGGALALGLSGGIGMMAAGLLGAPGIGYKQDFFATQQLRGLSEDTYARYRAEDAKRFPLVSDAVQAATGEDKLPAIAGIDNSKRSVLMDNGKSLKTDIDNLTAKGQTNAATEQLQTWWKTTGQPKAEEDKPRVVESVLFGSKQALLYTAAVPALMALGYLILLLYFKLMGGYKQVHLHETHPPMEEY
jgi:MFS family permease